MATVTLPAIGGTLAATGGTAAAAGGAAAAGTAAAAAGASTLATIATAATAAAAVGSLGLGLSSALGSSPKAAPTLAMPDPNDPAIMNQQRLSYAMTAGKSGRASTNLSSAGGGPNFSQTTAGSG